MVVKLDDEVAQNKLLILDAERCENWNLCCNVSVRARCE